MKEIRSPGVKEASLELHNLPARLPVLLWLESSKSWEGPFPFISIDGETAFVQLPHWSKTFWPTVIKPAIGGIMENWAVLASTDKPLLDIENLALFGTTQIRIASKDEAQKFKDARRKELRGIIDNKNFKAVKRSSVAKRSRIFGTRIIDAFKTVGDITNLKSWLIAQNYQEKNAKSIAKKSPTIQLASERIVCITGAWHKNNKPYNRDTPQAYIETKTKLDRLIYLEAPEEMRLQPDECLLVIRPLYGIPDSGIHWFLAIQDYHITNLGMVPATIDPCLLSKIDNWIMQGVTAMQVDDTFGHGSDFFLEVEKNNGMEPQNKTTCCIETIRDNKIQR